MSIASEIQRLQQAKADIANAITAKGGEVSGTIDTYAQAIEALPSSGGSEEYFKKIISGTLDEPLIIPDGVTSIGRSAFQYLNYANSDIICPLLTIPSSVTSVGQEAFRYARIKKIINYSSRGWSTYVFANNTDLEEIIWNSHNYGGNLCYNCTNLKRFIYKNITNYTLYIAGNTFQGCTSLELVDLSESRAIPTLASVNAFQNVPTTCEIRVPSSLYDNWIKATNWSTLYAQGYNFVAV